MDSQKNRNNVGIPLGLTIWKSSHYLCEYMLDNYIELFLSAEIPRKFSAIELGSGLGTSKLYSIHYLLLTFDTYFSI